MQALHALPVFKRGLFRDMFNDDLVRIMDEYFNTANQRLRTITTAAAAQDDYYFFNNNQYRPRVTYRIADAPPLQATWVEEGQIIPTTVGNWQFETVIPEGARIEDLRIDTIRAEPAQGARTWRQRILRRP